MPDAPRLYDDLAYLWPHLSPPEDYADEAETLAELIDDALGQPPTGHRWSVLELGAGGGHTAVHHKNRYDCTAVDLSEPMLTQCRKLNPEVPTVLGDMRDIRLGRQFDVVLICDAIDYMLTETDARAALTTAAAHLRPGGVFLMAPTYTHETFEDGEVADDGTPGTTPAPGSDQGAPGDHELPGQLPGVTFFSYVHDPDPADTQFEMILLYLIRDPQTRQVEVVEDRHTCGLFSIAEWQAMMMDAGIETEALAERAGQDTADPGGNDPADNASAWSVLFRGIKPA